MKNLRIPESIEEYISLYPPHIQDRLKDIHSLIKKHAPDSEEKISYRMPAYSLNGVLIYYAAYEKHIGLYPFTSAIIEFRDELSGYKTAKGSIQFPNDKPFPLKLISQIIEFRVLENREKAKLKAALKKNKRTITN